MRVMCEHENGWHVSQMFSILPSLSPQNCIYLARIMSLIKNNGQLSSEMQIYLSKAGANLLTYIQKKATELVKENEDDEEKEKNIIESYIQLRRYFIDVCLKGELISLTTESDNKLDLKRCELKNGKTLWLCDKHIAETNARVLSNAERKNLNANNDTNPNFGMLAHLNDSNSVVPGILTLLNFVYSTKNRVLEN